MFESEDDPAMTQKLEQLEDAARRLGLYLRQGGVVEMSRDVAEAMGTEVEGQPKMVVGVFTIGDQAFSDRVQRPEQDDVNDRFREIEVEEKKAEAQEIARKLLEERDDLDADE